MKIALEFRQQIETYLREAVTALQHEYLASGQVSQAAEMLREQIFEALAARTEDGAVDAAVVDSVLAEMPSPGEFALDAALAAGKARGPTDSSGAERLVRGIALVLTLAVLGMCMEGVVWWVRPPAMIEETNDSRPTTTTTLSVVTTQSASTTSDDVPLDDDFAPGLLIFGVGILVYVIAVIVVILLVMAAVVVVIFGAGAAFLCISLGALNAAVSVRRRSWMAFPRLCAWELPLAAGALGGMICGALVWLRSPSGSLGWRACGYTGMGLGTLVGLVGSWIAIVGLTWSIRLAIRHKQRHLPLLKLAALRKLRGLTGRPNRT